MNSSITFPESHPSTVNVAARLSEMARAMPQALAVVEPVARSGDRWSYRSITFDELDADSGAIAAGLLDFGIEPGMRMALLVAPGIDFVSLAFALLKARVVQILIDPGMGPRRMLKCLSDADPHGFIAISRGQVIRSMMRRCFRRAQLNVTVGRRWFWGGPTLEQVRRRGACASAAQLADLKFQFLNVSAETPAAIAFTSGSTGPAKGVLYRHGNFDRQVTEIRDYYGIQRGEVDVPCFPLFGLFNAAMGVTSVVPAMNPSRPAMVDPRNIIAAINDWQATQVFGSPAIWNVVGRYCERHNIRLPSLRRVLSAGAPVPAHVLRRMKACIHPNGEMHTPYGATEALPVASNCGAVVLGETLAQTEQGAGVCVGRRFGGIQWRVIRISDDPISTTAELIELPRGEVGELIVRGPVVTTEYYANSSATAAAKIQDIDGRRFWHRMGDVGRLDEQDRFWFWGRMSQRVTTVSGHMFTIPCEAIFNQHPRIYRSALVGIGSRGQQIPAIVVEPLPGAMPSTRMEIKQLIGELRELAVTAAHTTMIERIFIRKSLPVDVRHNVKINREQLAVWAAKQRA
ncbi:MAG: AMP-binding protein [Pirellulales bacterium]|nr:AMP-binding protein [Pirellulales bacterium]